LGRYLSPEERNFCAQELFKSARKKRVITLFFYFIMGTSVKAYAGQDICIPEVSETRRYEQ